jgi:hypothetical protein
MSVRDRPLQPARAASPARREAVLEGRGDALLGGGTDGNEVLTTATGILLILLLAALGVTILLLGQLLAEHLFLGLLLLGPLALKLASTGYRFARYYAGSRAYREKGPPWTPLRLLAPMVVLFTLAVFVTGVVLLAVGPAGREPWLLLHKATFIIWLGFFGLHVLGHLPEMSRMLGLRAELLQLPGIRTDLERVAYARSHAGEDTPPTGAAEATVAHGPGSRGRLLVLAGSLLVGLAVAAALIPDFHTWTSWVPAFHGEH